VDSNASYFIQTFKILVLSAFAFLILKEVMPESVFPEPKIPQENVLIDTHLLETIKNIKKSAVKTDTDLDKPSPFFDTIIKKDNKSIKKHKIKYPLENYVEYRGFQHLIPFYEKLNQLETKKEGKIRIAYFGDSMNDGDMIVQDVRALFQNQYGGKGVGFVSVTSESSVSRSSIKHQHSNNWKTQSYLNVKRPQKPFGVNGHVFFANDTINSTWVQYRDGDTFNENRLMNPTFFYGNSTNKDGKLIIKIGVDTLVFTKN